MASDTQSSPLSVDQTAKVFESLLFPPEGQESREKTPAAPPEAKAEGQPAETPAEVTEPTPAGAEEPAPTTATAADQPETPPQVPETYTVRVDGEEVTVTLEEALQGYQRAADYTRKTQALADQRKLIEAEAAKARALEAQYATLIANAEAGLKELYPEEPDWTALRRQVPPDQFAAQWDEWQRLKSTRDLVAQERARVQAAQAATARTELAKQLEVERERLLKAFPAWSDPAILQAETAQIATYARGLGFSDEQLGQVTDHRLVQLIDKARRWDALQAQKSAVQAKVAPKLKAATPGAAPGKPPADLPRRRALAKLAETARSKKGRNIDEAASYFEQILPD